MRRFLKIFSVLTIMSLAACSSQTQPVSLAAKYNALVQDSHFSSHAMRKVVQSAYRQNDLPLMGKALWKLCQRDVATGSRSTHCQEFLDVAIIQKDAFAQAKANIALYFLLGEQLYYQRAVALLPDQEQFYTSLLEPDLNQCLNSEEQHESLAMQCYVAGKHFNDKTALKKALMLFEIFDAQHNMADTYFLLAQLAQQENQWQHLNDYAAKAALILSQLGEDSKANSVRDWRRDAYAQ